MAHGTAVRGSDGIDGRAARRPHQRSSQRPVDALAGLCRRNPARRTGGFTGTRIVHRSAQPVPHPAPAKNVARHLPYGLPEHLPYRPPYSLPDRLPVLPVEHPADCLPDHLSDQPVDSNPDLLPHHLPVRLSGCPADQPLHHLPDRGSYRLQVGLPHRLLDRLPDRPGDGLPDGLPVDWSGHETGREAREPDCHKLHKCDG